MSECNVLIYALNPLVVIELAGNAHYESVMILFLMLAIFFLRSQKISVAALSFGLSVSTKLLPLMFLPSLWPMLGRRSSVIFYMITAGVCVTLFLPFLNLFALDGLTNSLGYFFSRFEFNASVYYIVREAGLVLAGYNIIHIAGPALAALATILIMWISLKSRIPHESRMLNNLAADGIIQWMKTVMWCMTIYLLFTTIVHPWYITTLVAISIFTTYRFVVVWTLMIFFTYAGYSLRF
jgi:hypothetical protein